MNYELDPDALVNAINPETLKVRPPRLVVFLCGGVIGKKEAPPATLRDAFSRAHDAAKDQKYKVILVESAKPLTADAGYSDLLTFESDIAGAVGLIVLFAESAGSLAELGSFAASNKIAPSILAILDDFYYAEDSFIKNGPVRHLENEYGEDWILVLERSDIGISDRGQPEGLDVIKLFSQVSEVIERRLGRRHALSKLDITNNGHLILLISGLCQEYGALTITEIERYLNVLGITMLSRPRIKNLLYCAELLGWIKEKRKGNYNYFVSTGGDPAIDYSLKTSGQIGTIVSKGDVKVKFRGEIRSHWENHERARINAIRECLQEGIEPQR